MCHLSLEKALKGLFIKQSNQFPPKLHDLMYFVERLELDIEDSQIDFLMWLNRMGVTTRYPEDLRNIINLFSQEDTNNIYQETKTIQQWIKQQ